MFGSSGISSQAGSAMRFSQTRGRIQGGAGYGLNYPNPFFDVAHTYLPTTVKQMFRWCRYYFLTNPLINTVVFKMSEYPVTDIVIDHPDKEVVNRWTEYFQDHLRYRAFQVETGLDYNCVSGDTRVVTEDGVFPIRELAGRTVRVLSQGGVYREAAFKSYGQQRLWEVHTDDGVLFATEEHRWLVQSTKGAELREVVTKQLKGKRVPRVVAPRPAQDSSFWEGVRHGVIFGDGTLSNEGQQAHVCLVSQEKRYLARYFEAHATITSHHANEYLGVYGLPPEYKRIPSATASASYWYGFTCGLLATDGSVDNRGQAVLTQKDPAVLLEIAKRLPWFGIVGGRVREHTAWSQYTKQMEPMNYLSLKTQSLQGQDFVRADQRAAFEKFFEPTGYGSFVGVKRVVATNRVEEVFCCEEPETHSFVIENGLLTGNCYGNCLTSIGYPFVKYLTCRVCKNTEQADKLRPYWQLVNYEFRLTCPHCGQTAEAQAKDSYNKSASGIRMIRWNPEDVEITYNDITGDYSHFYTVPSTVRNDIVMGKKDVVEKIPQIFIQALKEQKGIIFSKQNLFHLRRPTLATQDRGWGIPLLLPVLKDVFYLQIMKKAQETVLLEHALPLRVLFPQAGSGSSDPYCVSPATLVETPVGLLPASEVRAGDYLRSHTGAWRAVEATKTRPIAAEEKVFRFKVASLAAFPFEVSEEHPILAVPCVSRKRPRQGLVDPAFIPAQELKKGDYVAYPVKRIVRGPQELDLADYVTRSVTDAWVYRRLNQETAEIYEWMESTGDLKFAWGERKKLLDARGWSDANYCTAYSMRQEGSIDRVPRYLPVTKELACLVGYFLAEGSMRDTLATFALHLKEEHYASEIEHAVLHLGFRGVSHSERVSQNGREVCVDDVILSELLSSLCGTGFANKRIPDVLSEAEDNLVLGMLRCLFNGDGTYFETDTIRLGLKLANPSVILEARRLLLSFGYIGGVMKEEPTATSLHKTTSYQLNFNGESAKHVSLLLRGLEDYNPRPAQRSGVIRGDYVLLRIDEMEPIDSVPEVIGFQMAEDKSFCVAGVATHNTSINLVEWREHVATEVGRWRTDPAYIPIMPLPIGHQVIGGDGKALMLNAEIQQWSDSIVAGMGVPREFVYGGLTWSGSNVSLRMLENMFLGYNLRQKAMARWVMQEVSSFLDWPVANIRFKPFKMADDMQRKAFNFQLNAANKLSDTTLLADSDFSQDDENEIMKNETATRLEATKLQQVAMAEIQGEASLIMAKYQVKAQQISMEAQQAAIAQGEPGGPEDDGAGGVAGGQEAGGGSMPQGMESGLNGGQRLPPGQAGGDIQAMAYMQAKTIAAMPANQQSVAVQNLYATSPELAELVVQALRSMGVKVAPPGQQQPGAPAPGGAPGASAPADAGVDMTPLPEQRAPRRGLALV